MGKLSEAAIKLMQQQYMPNRPGAEEVLQSLFMPNNVADLYKRANADRGGLENSSGMIKSGRHARNVGMLATPSEEYIGRPAGGQNPYNDAVSNWGPDNHYGFQKAIEHNGGKVAGLQGSDEYNDMPGYEPTFDEKRAMARADLAAREMYERRENPWSPDTSEIDRMLSQPAESIGLQIYDDPAAAQAAQTDFKGWDAIGDMLKNALAANPSLGQGDLGEAVDDRKLNLPSSPVPNGPEAGTFGEAVQAPDKKRRGNQVGEPIMESGSGSYTPHGRTPDYRSMWSKGTGGGFKGGQGIGGGFSGGSTKGRSNKMSK